jgi:hypothetical protein
LPRLANPSNAINFSELDRANWISSGSDGTVYKVIHHPTNLIYALKVIYGTKDSVHRQIRTGDQDPPKCGPPNVVKCHDMFDYTVKSMCSWIKPNGEIHQTKIHQTQ